MFAFSLRLLPMLALLLMVSCVEDTASREECEQACKHQQQLAVNAGTGKEDVKPKASAELKRKLDALGKELVDELKRLEAEQKDLLDKAASEKEKARIKKDYNKRVEAEQNEYQPKFEAIREQINEAKDTAKEPSSVKKEEAGLEEARSISDCADHCLENTDSKDKIACRMRATSLEQFKACH